MTLAYLMTVLLGLFSGGLLVFILRASQLRILSVENQRLQDALQQQAIEAARQQERLLAAGEQEKISAAVREKLEQERSALELALRERETRFAEIDTRLQAEREQVAVQARFVKEQEQMLKLQFEQLATKIFEEKSQKFSEQNKTGLDTLLSPLREQIKDFREKVENTYSNEARERFALKEQILRLEGLNRQISDDASNLAKALKGDKKLQGNWGEMILTRVLEQSGLHEGREYVTQFSTRNDDGQRMVPDAIVHLPENRDIVIDSKVSLNDYMLYCEAEGDDERKLFLKQHTTAVRNHIKTLSEKRYEDLPELRTLDFVFMFMPVEAAFMLAVEHDKALFSEAFDKKIIIVSPTTLLATLRTVESIWRYERQNQNAEKIAKEAGGLHDKFVTLLGHLEDLGRAIERSQDSYRKTIAGVTGHGGLMGRVKNLKDLGAKAKKSLPSPSAAVLGDPDNIADETDAENAES
ncbi:MAG: DNA recombination protein RmuC [bacterium]|nr:DNA recombination protein RmuC [bacterium]